MRSAWYSKKLGVAVAGLLLCAAAPDVARAQTTTTREQNVAFDRNNPCVGPPPGEHFTGTGTFTTQEETSPNKFRFRTHLQGQGVNDPRTAKYNVLEISENEMITTSKNSKIEFEDRRHYIREGKSRSAPTKYDDFFERTRTTVVNGRTVHDDMRTECK